MHHAMQSQESVQNNSAPSLSDELHRRRRRVATVAPYVTDTHYKTPPARSDLEAALRAALVRKEWLRVNELLSTLRASSVFISGGVLDVAMHTLLRMNGEVVPTDPPEVDGLAGSQDGTGNPSSLGPAQHQRGAVGAGNHPDSFHSSDCSDDERQLVPKGSFGSNIAHLHSQLHLHTNGQRLPPPQLFLRGGSGGPILVPASSLPAAAIPSILQESGGGAGGADWRTTIGAMPTAKPTKGSTGNKPGIHGASRHGAKPHQYHGNPYTEVGDCDTSDGYSSTMSTPPALHYSTGLGSSLGASGGSNLRWGGALAASPGGGASLSSTPQLTLAGFLADDSPTAQALIKKLLEYPHYETSYCGAVAVAVELGDIGCVRVLLRERRFDPNTGCPVRMAVTMNRTDCMEMLLVNPRINPNRGAPLYNAVVQQKLWAVKALLEHPHTQVNRYATGMSTTPLLAAIRACAAMNSGGGGGALASPLGSMSSAPPFVGPTSALPPDHHHHHQEEMSSVVVVAPGTTLSNRHNSASLRGGTAGAAAGGGALGGSGGTGSGGGVVNNNSVEEVARCVIQCSRTDINKGFAITPLQLAVSLGELEIVRWILTKPNAAPNRAIGVWPMPLEIAIEQGDVEMTNMLLSDPRVFVTEEMVNQLEASNNLPILQLVASLSQDVRIGYVWTMRCLAMVASAITLGATGVCELIFIAAASHIGVRSYSIWMVGLNVVGCVVATASLLRRRRQHEGIAAVSWHLAVVPFLPVPEIAMAVHVVRWIFSEAHDLYFRQRLFEMCYLLALVRGLCVLLPQCIVLGVAFASAPHQLHSYAAATLFFNVLALFVCGAIRALRIPRSPTLVSGDGSSPSGGAARRHRQQIAPLLPGTHITMSREIAV